MGQGDQWTAEQCAAHWGVKRATWESYVARGQAPRPTGFDPDTGRRVWDAAVVRSRKPGAKWESEEETG